MFDEILFSTGFEVRVSVTEMKIHCASDISSNVLEGLLFCNMPCCEGVSRFSESML